MFDNRILHIEDNFHNRRIVRKILEKQGYVLHEAADGIIGLNMIKEFTPPVVLLDISLPGMDGIEIAQRVKADDQYKHIILIAVTASAMQGDRERFLAAGCDDYLSKPFRSIDLIEIVNQHFEDLRKKAGLEETIDAVEEPLEAPAPTVLSETFDSTALQAFEEDTQKLEKAETIETPEPELDTSQEENELLKTASLQELYAGQLPEEERGETPETEETPSEEADETLRLPSIKSLNEIHKFKPEEEETPEPESIEPMEMSESLDTLLAQEIGEDVSQPPLETGAPEEVKDPPTTASFRDWMSSETEIEQVETKELEEEETLESESVSLAKTGELTEPPFSQEIEEDVSAPILEADTPEEVEEIPTTAPLQDWMSFVTETEGVQTKELEVEETPEPESVSPAETGELTEPPFSQEIEEDVSESTLEADTPEEVEEIPTTAPLQDWMSSVTETEEIQTKELEDEEIPEPESVSPAETGELTEPPFSQEIEEDVSAPILEVEPPEDVEEIPSTAPLQDWMSSLTETEKVQTKELEDEETPEEVKEIPSTAPLQDWMSPTTETEEVQTKELTEEEIAEISTPVTSMDEAETIRTPSDWIREVQETEPEEEEYLELIEASHDDTDSDTRPLRKPKRDQQPVKEPASTQTRTSESSQLSDILSKVLGMINPETLRPVDPNVDFDSV